MEQNYFSAHSGYNTYLQSKEAREHNWRESITILSYHLRGRIDLAGEKRVLEIWFWPGSFSSFVFATNPKTHYTGIDIDDSFVDINSAAFPGFKFLCARFQDFLRDTSDEYDYICAFHVFEHLDEIERREFLECVHRALKPGWEFINFMPNADSILETSHLRYVDITHKTSYCAWSFNQLVNCLGIPFASANHYNTYLWRSVIKRMIHQIFLFMTKVYFMGMWANFPKIYTQELISVYRK